ncbi:MAG: fatty acid desaturase [Nitratireductor sp.]|nr:fatty acid desaturase [Nitratireductor sp.]
MDQKAFIASLDDNARIDLTSRTDGPGVVRLLQQWGLLAAMAAWIAAGLPFWPAFLLPLGILIVFQFTLLHETVHNTPFASPWLNRLAGRMAALLVLVPHDWFHYFHMAHHRHTQDPDNDPELESPKPETLAQYALHVSGLPLWKSSITNLLHVASGKCDFAYVPAKARDRVVRDARRMVAIYSALIAVSVLTVSGLLLWIWVIPAMLGQPFLRLYLLAEHGRCPLVANMFENTRTTFTNRLILWLAWNMPYHAEHHAWPMVPFHQLPQLHKFAKDHLHVTENGYAAFTGKYVAGLK